MARPPGYILWESDQIACIMNVGSKNVKTGDMNQTHIIPINISPGRSTQTGDDVLVCGDCPRRPLVAKSLGLKPCYVQVFRSPTNVWEAYHRGRYLHAYQDGVLKLEVIQALNDRPLRIGAWGDGAVCPLEMWKDVLQFTPGWTGYTHQWRRLDPEWRHILMASCDSEQDCLDAAAAGWSYFFVREKEDQFPPNGVKQFQCPAAKEAHGGTVTCAKCLLCCGTQTRRGNEQLKGVYISAH